MKMPPPTSTDLALRAENVELRTCLEEAKETLRAIRDGEVDALVVEGQDGPRIFTLQGLDAEQNRLRGEMLAQVHDAVITTDGEDRITYINPAAEQLYRVRNADVVGQKFSELYTRQWPSPEAEATALATLEECGHWRGEKLHRTREGRMFPVEASIAILHNADTGERGGLIAVIRDITLRRQLEQEKSEALRLLDTLLTHAPVGFVFLDRDLRFVRINDRLAEINGMTIAAHLGKTVAEILPTLEATLREVTARILATGQPVLDQEFTGETASAPGITRSWHQSWYPVHDERGEIIGFGALVEDITERKQAEASLRLSADRIELAVRASKARLWQQDLDLRYTWLYNPMPGFDALGKREADLLEHAEDVARIESLKREVIRSGVGMHKEFSPRIQGVVHWFDLLMEPLRDAAGNITGLTGAAIEITERKRAEETLRDKERQLRFVMDSAPLKIFTANPNGDLDYANPQWSEYAGHPAEGMQEGGWAQFLHPDEVEANAQAWRSAVLTGEPYMQEHCFRRADGEYRWHLTRAVALKDEQGEVLMWIGSNTDIEDVKKADEAVRERLELEVERRTADLLAINEQLQGFTYAVAHDLRQQIRGMSANSSMLLSDAAEILDEDSRHTLSRLRDSSQKLGRLVDELLTYARLGKHEPTKLPFDLTALAEEVAGFLIERGSCRQGTRFKIEPDLKSRGDVAMVRIVLENLLDNACKYSAKTENPVIEVARHGDAFVVRDNGIGFDMKYVHKLFEPFERLHGDEKVYAGTGIGLANVKRIVEKHGGRTWAEGRPGQGAAFYFSLG